MPSTDQTRQLRCKSREHVAVRELSLSTDAERLSLPGQSLGWGRRPPLSFGYTTMPKKKQKKQDPEKMLEARTEHSATLSAFLKQHLLRVQPQLFGPANSVPPTPTPHLDSAHRALNLALRSSSLGAKIVQRSSLVALNHAITECWMCISAGSHSAPHHT